MTLCLKLDGGCDGITPPKCSPNSNVSKLFQLSGGFRSRVARKFDADQQLQQHLSELETLDVFTSPIVVLGEKFSEISAATGECVQTTFVKENSSSGFDGLPHSPFLPLLLLISLISLIVLIPLIFSFRRRRGKFTLQ